MFEHALPSKRDFDIPVLTEAGVQHGKLDQALHQELLAYYQRNRTVNESVPGFIGADNGRQASVLTELHPQTRVKIHNHFKPLCEAWIGHQYELVPTFVYGLRTYQRGAWLKVHRDRNDTHVVSAILQIAQKVDKDWPLYMEGKDGDWLKLVMKPGDYVLYEGNRLEHGRPEPFEGDGFTNVFVHFRLGAKR